MNKIEYLRVPYELKRFDTKAGSFDGYAAVKGNIDRGDDRIMAGAFVESLKTFGPDRPIPLTLDHRKVIGTAQGVEDEIGLRVRGFPLDEVQDGRETMALMRVKALREMSFGYVVKQARFVVENGVEIREILEVEIIEVAVVFKGMNDLAQIVSVKSADLRTDDETTGRDYLRRRLMRGAGLSAELADVAVKAIFGHANPEPDEGLATLLAAVVSLSHTMSGDKPTEES